MYNRERKNMSKVVKKENGQVVVVEPTRELVREIKGTYHMCWDCANARSDKCSKVHDRNKLGLDSYEYITDGYQIYGKNNEIDTFIVVNCNNFVKDENKKYTSVEKAKLKKLKEDIMTTYFDAESADESYLIQDRQLKSTSENNAIYNPRGKRPTPREIVEIRRRSK